MSEELLYTSAPRGLQNSKYGFCTVLASDGLDLNLSKQLEALSGYRHLFPLGSESEHKNPVAFSHVKLMNRHGSSSVISRVTSYNADYTGRSNKIAHHIALAEKEYPDAGPAWLVQQSEIFRTTWDGKLRTVPCGPLIPLGHEELKKCSNWERLTGDAGLGGHLAELIQHSQKIIWMIYPIELRDEILDLIRESIHLLPTDKRWEATFSTYASEVPPNVMCKVRGVIEGTKEARLANSRGVAFSLVHPPVVNENSAFVQRARGNIHQPFSETEADFHTKVSNPLHKNLLRQSVTVSSDIKSSTIESELHLHQAPVAPKPPALPHEKTSNRIIKVAVVITACLLLIQQLRTLIHHSEKAGKQRITLHTPLNGQQKQISDESESTKLQKNEINSSAADNLRTKHSLFEHQPNDQRPPKSFPDVKIGKPISNTDSTAGNNGRRQINNDPQPKNKLPTTTSQITNSEPDSLKTLSKSKNPLVRPALEDASLSTTHTSVDHSNNVQLIDATAHIAIEDLAPNIFSASGPQKIRISIQARSNFGPVGNIIKANHNSFNQRITPLVFTIPKQKDFTHLRFPVSTSSRQTKPITIALTKQDANTTGEFTIQITPESDEIFSFLTISTKHITSDFIPPSLRQHYLHLQDIRTELTLTYQKLPEFNTRENFPNDIIPDLNNLRHLLRNLLSSVHTQAERQSLRRTINVLKWGILEQISDYSVVARSNEPTGIGDKNIRHSYNYLAESIKEQCNQILANEQILYTHNQSLLNPAREEHLDLSCLDFEVLDSSSETEPVAFRFGHGKINYFSVKQAATDKK